MIPLLLLASTSITVAICRFELGQLQPKFAAEACSVLDGRLFASETCSLIEHVDIPGGLPEGGVINNNNVCERNIERERVETSESG